MQPTGHLMDPLDAAMLTAELLGNAMHVGVVMMLTPPSDAGDDYVDGLYDDAVAAGVEVDPQLLRRAYRGIDTGGLWGWQQVEELRVADHVQRVTLEDGSPSELWELVSRLHEEPLPRDRPMWAAVLVDGLADGRFAFYLKVHHALVDGISGFRMIEASMTTDPDRRDMPPFFGAKRAAAEAAPRRGGLPNPVRVARSAASSAARAATGAAGLGARIVEGQLDNVLKGLTSDTTVLPFRAPRTRLNTSLTSARTFAAGTWDRDRLRAVQKAAEGVIPGVTSNDVVTAMIAGGLRAWFAEHDELPADSLVAICPVSVRGRDDDEDTSGGNAFGTAVCNLGTALEDPLERLDLVHRSMDVAKDRVLDLGSVPSLLVAAPSILPTILLPMLPFDPLVRPGYNLPISNVPGPRHDLYWNGAHLDELYPVSVVYDGMALNVTVCSYADRVCFGYLAGRDAMPDVEDLVPQTEEALAELERALGLR